MKTLIFCILILGLISCAKKDTNESNANAIATEGEMRVIESNETTFDDMLDAIEQVESGGDPNAMGDAAPITLKREVGATAEVNYRAIGAYQIHREMILDVNRILGYNKFTNDARWDKKESREICKVYLNHYCKGKTFEYMARCWNGGPTGYKKKSTKKYWIKVKSKLESL